MNNTLILTLTLALMLFGPQAARAGDDADSGEQQIVIALTTDDFELAATDISHLAVGEAETVYTESGKTIDLLRTEDGVEIYVDGERLDTGLHVSGHHGDHHAIQKHVEIICDEAERENGECAELALLSDEEIDLENLADEGHGMISIHEGHADGGYEVLIEKDIDIHPGEHGRKVIVIEKKGEEI
jgi:hypothetical protein